MKTSTLDGRLLVQVALALTGKTRGGDDHDALELRARSQGLSGAEIDAARAGRCFEVRAGAAAAFAIALSDADEELVRVCRAQGLRLGLEPGDLDDIALWVTGLRAWA